MNIAEPKYREHLRDLPSSYLLDLIIDVEGVDHPSIYWILEERGLTREEIDQALQRRRVSPWLRPHTLWSIARWATIINTVIVTWFNLSCLYRLLHTDHPFRGPLLFFTLGCIGFGFVIGYKLTTHVYQGSRAMLYCGFPIPVGYVNLENGEEIQQGRNKTLLWMALNALTGISLTLFPLMFLFIMMD